MIDDADLESSQSDLVDFAFALGVGYINLRGIGRAEREAKVDHFQEILEQLREQVTEKSHVASSHQLSNQNLIEGSVNGQALPDDVISQAMSAAEMRESVVSGSAGK